MTKLLKLVIVGTMMFGASAFAENDNSMNNSAIIMTDSEQCTVGLFNWEYVIDLPLALSLWYGTSVHVVDNKNMVKAVCQLDDRDIGAIGGYPETETEIPLVACAVTDGAENVLFAQKSLLVIPSLADHTEYGTMPTVECTYKGKRDDR